MRKPWIAVQLPVTWNALSVPDAAALQASLRRARELAHADAVILRPGGELGPAVETAAAARRAGMEIVLWFPVLSDLPGSPVVSATVNADGTLGHGRAGAWNGLTIGDETFLFACPNDARHRQAARETLSRMLDALRPQGVMLDKIRFPSPANGMEALFCCFCDSCDTVFQEASGVSTSGVSMEELRRQAGRFVRLLRSSGVSELEKTWTDPGSFWSAAGLADLAAFRARSVSAAVRDLAEVVKARSLHLGLDLFSPCLAPFVGQDYPTLGALCDWIKPMTYRAAIGPAGLPLEIAGLWQGLLALAPRSGADVVRRLLDGVFPLVRLPASAADLLCRGLDASVIGSELAEARAACPSARLFAGIEAVQIPEFGINVSPRDLEASLRAVEGRADGLVASWDLLRMPDDNLRLIGAMAA